MSDAAKEAKNLDVMSSVRRKISTGKAGGKSKTMGVDKLILTASLRVDDGTDLSPAAKTPVVVDAPEPIVKANDQPAQDGDALSNDGIKAEADLDAENMESPVDVGAAEEGPLEESPTEASVADDTPADATPAKESPAVVGAVAKSPGDDTDDREILTAGSLTSSTSTLMDEDMLRDMISEIVRQELQGELGEKITRNVRKLVRREIHRTMVSNDLS